MIVLILYRRGGSHQRRGERPAGYHRPPPEEQGILQGKGVKPLP